VASFTSKPAPAAKIDAAREHSLARRSHDGSAPGAFHRIQIGGHSFAVPDTSNRHRVLIVDDHPDAAQALAMVVRLLGHECVTATSGREAIAQSLAHEFDLAIVDIGLPDVSGYEVARELRAQSTGRRLYLAAVSGWGQPEDRTRALEAGFDHHVLKPVDVGIVRRIVSLAERAAAAASS
jgi:DNA-binding response OmpR family regulator